MSAIALDPLIAEARRRARRRRLLAAVAIAAGIGTVVWATFPTARPPLAGSGGSRPSSSPGAHVPIFGFGVAHLKSRGLISAQGRSGLWLSANSGRSWHLVRVSGLHGRYLWSRFVYNDFVDLTHGWAVTYSHNRVEIERTSDAGRTWHVSYLPGHWPGAGFLGFAFRTPQAGYLAIQTLHYRSERFVTTDGGAIWRLAPSTPRLLRPQRAFKVAFSPGPGEPVGTLVQTNDHGRHWARVPLPFDRSVSYVKSFGRLVVVPGHMAGCSDLGVYVSEDAGRSWKPRCAPRAIDPGIPQFNVSIPAPGVWYALSGGLASGRTTLWATHDEGRSWHVVPIAGVHPAWGTEPVYFVNARLGWALGGRGSILVRTTDGGRHWVPAGPRLPKLHRRR